MPLASPNQQYQSSAGDEKSRLVKNINSVCCVNVFQRQSWKMMVSHRQELDQPHVLHHRRPLRVLMHEFRCSSRG